MFKDGGTRLQISLISTMVEVARGVRAAAAIQDVINRRFTDPVFALGVIKLRPRLRVTLFHPGVKYQIHYLPAGNILRPFFYVGNRPLENTDYTLHSVWPGGIGGLFAIIDGCEKFLADRSHREYMDASQIGGFTPPLPYQPLLPAWRKYRNLC